jgi:23S rRNA pseudouridine1911/1915/1917 synthase
VHRLDKQTSGLIVVAKDDVTHRKLSEMFATRELEKTYLALVHGSLSKDNITISLPIGRDLVRRTRMTTRRSPDSEGVRAAVSHVKALERISSNLYGRFTLVEVKIETGRTHQIRVHLQSLGHPVVGDTLYGAPHQMGQTPDTRSLDRNFLHAARLAFQHPRTRKAITLEAPLPSQLAELLAVLRAG